MQNEHKYLKVKDRPDLVRDVESKAILSTDLRALQEHREKKRLFKQLLEKTNEVDQLKNDVQEIKAMLQQLLQNK